MKSIKYITAIVWLLLLWSCSGDKVYRGDSVGKIVNVDSLIATQPHESIADLYYKHGNVINTSSFPYIVRATEVYKHTNDWLLIDIRSKDAYEAGHVNGAYNVPKEDIIDFLTEKQKAAAYDKVVLICYSGQMASYVTGVLRFAGFNNVYVMLHGMAAWNSEFSGILKKNFGLNYRNMVVATDNATADNEEHASEETPKIDVEKLPALEDATVSNVLAKARELLKQPRPKFLIKADELFPALQKNPDAYYVIFYLNQKEYDKGHIKGAHLFTSRKDLSLGNRLTELPKDKPVVVYCKSGHTGGQTVAYLQMMGYNAVNLMFGRNSFGFNVFTDDISSISNDFPVVAGSKRTNNKIVQSASGKSKAKKTSKPIVKRKKKAVSGGCG